METRNKAIFGLISALIFLALLGAMVMYGARDAEEESRYTIVYLGDSIAEGILGPSPLSERDSYCYYALVGRINNYRYVDRSISGDTTFNLYNHLASGGTFNEERRHQISKADIIHISILGNDLLGGDLAKTTIEAIDGDFTNIEQMIARAEHYFALSMKKIKKLNPNATILINTVYNPMHAESLVFTAEQRAALLAYVGGDAAAIRLAGDKLLLTLNNVIYDYLDAYPDSFEIVDVYTAFNKVYKQDSTAGLALLYPDGVHPSNRGHAFMAELIQEKLVELGLADYSYALPRYKHILHNQLDRLYKGQACINIRSTQKAIAKATSLSEAATLYFSATHSCVPNYVGTPILPHKGERFNSVRELYVKSVAVGLDDFSAFLDKKKSTFTFNTDGSFSLKVAPNSVLLSMASLAISTMGEIDIAEIMSVGNFGASMDVFLDNIFPDFDLHNFADALTRLQSIGVYLQGIDYQDDNITALCESLSKNYTIPAKFKIPKGLYIEVKGYYFVEQDGDFTNVYMCVGNVANNGYPLLFGILQTDAEGKSYIEAGLEVTKVIVTAVEQD